jgi:hypothetical protein
MTHDGFSSYARFGDAAHQQCVDHALRRARRLANKHKGRAKEFPRRVIDLLTGALKLRDRFDEEKAGEDRRDRAYWDYLGRLYPENSYKNFLTQGVIVRRGTAIVGCKAALLRHFAISHASPIE